MRFSVLLAAACLVFAFTLPASAHADGEWQLSAGVGGPSRSASTVPGMLGGLAGLGSSELGGLGLSSTIGLERALNSRIWLSLDIGGQLSASRDTGPDEFLAAEETRLTERERNSHVYDFRIGPRIQAGDRTDVTLSFLPWLGFGATRSAQTSTFLSQGPDDPDDGSAGLITEEQQRTVGKSWSLGTGLRLVLETRLTNTVYLRLGFDLVRGWRTWGVTRDFETENDLRGTESGRGGNWDLGFFRTPNIALAFRF